MSRGGVQAWGVAEALAVVVPDRGALPCFGGVDGSFVAMTVAQRADAPVRLPSVGGGGPPIEARRGQRVRVWRISTGDWVEPFAGWNCSWGARWSPDKLKLAAYVQDGDAPPTVAVWSCDGKCVTEVGVDCAPFFTFERPVWMADGSGLLVETPAHSREPAPDGAATLVSVLTTEVGADGQEADVKAAVLDASDLSLVRFDGTREVLAHDWTVRAWRLSPDGKRVGCMRMTCFDTQAHQVLFDLEVIDISTGQVTTLVGGISQNYGLGWSWSPDGTTIAYLVTGAHRHDELCIVAADGGSSPQRLVDGSQHWPARGSYDETGGYEAPGWINNATLVWHREGFGFLTVRLPEDPRNRAAAHAAAGGGQPTVVVTRTPAGESEQWLFAVDDGAPIGDEDGCFLSVRASDDVVWIDRIDSVAGTRTAGTALAGAVHTSTLHVGSSPMAGGLFIIRSAQQPGELWAIDEDGAPRRVAALNPDLRLPYRVSETRGSRSHQTSRGGLDSELAAGLLLPTTQCPAQGWPLVISVYGGARSSKLVHQFDPDNGILHSSLLTARGCAVLFPDLPMTDEDPLEQFAPLLRKSLGQAQEAIPVDPQRVAVIGNSYGSYTVLSLLVTMSSTFSAAVISAPIINPLASYGSLRPDGHAFDGYWENAQGRMGGPPWAAPGTWTANNPFLRLDQVDTPLLIGVGSRGLPGEQAQAEQLFGGLRRLGLESELRRYNGQDHAPSSWTPDAYADFANRSLDWITSHALR